MGLEIIVNNEKLDVGGVKIGLTFNNPLFDDKNTDRSYSFAFGVQLTPTNKRILKHAERIDSPILNDEFPCTLIIDSALYLEGVLIIKKRTNRGYRCYWTNESTSAVKKLKDIKINQLQYEPIKIATPDINWIFRYKQMYRNGVSISPPYTGIGTRKFSIEINDKTYSFDISTTDLNTAFIALKDEINLDNPSIASYGFAKETTILDPAPATYLEETNEYYVLIINVPTPILNFRIGNHSWYGDSTGTFPGSSRPFEVLGFYNSAIHPASIGLPDTVAYNWLGLWTNITTWLNSFETDIKAAPLSQKVCFPTLKNSLFYGKEGNAAYLSYINYHPYVFEIVQPVSGSYKHNYSPLVFLGHVFNKLEKELGIKVFIPAELSEIRDKIVFYNNNSLDENYKDVIPPTTPAQPALNTFKEFIYLQDYLPEMTIEELFSSLADSLGLKIIYKNDSANFFVITNPLISKIKDWTEKTAESYGFEVINTKGFEIKYERDSSDEIHSSTTDLDGYHSKDGNLQISPLITTTKTITEQDDLDSSRFWIIPEVKQEGKSITLNKSGATNKPKFLIYQGYQEDSNGNEYPMASNHFVDVSNNRVGDLSLLIKGEEGIYEKRYKQWLTFVSDSKLVEKQLILAAHEINELIKWEEPIRKIYHNKGTLKGIVKSIEFSVDANGISSPVNAEIVAEGISKLPVFEQVAEVITPSPPSLAPTISSISYAPLVSNQTKDIVIIGTNFTATTTVSIIKGANIITVNSVTFDSPTQLTVNVTSGTVVSGFDVTVNNGSPVTSVDGLFVEDTQKINFINPATTTNDYADLGTILNGARTVELFITLNSAVEPDDTVIGRNVTNGKLFMAFNAGNNLKVQIDNGTGNKFAYADNLLTVGTRYRVSLRLDSTDKMRIFIDGVAQANNADVNTAITNQTVSAYMAKFANLNIRHGDYTIERLDVWSTSRTQPQMAAGINRVPTPGEPGLIDSFPFLNETGGTSTGINGNTITLHTATAGGTTHINNQMRQIV